jgi:hypothetical protein
MTAISIAWACIAVTPAIHRPSVVTAAIRIVAAIAIPRAGTNKYAASEPRRAIVSIRRAGIRIVVVVTIRTHGSRIGITPIHWRADSDSNRDLGMRISRRREQQNTQYSEIA